MSIMKTFSKNALAITFAAVAYTGGLNQNNTQSASSAVASARKMKPTKSVDRVKPKKSNEDEAKKKYKNLEILLNRLSNFKF